MNEECCARMVRERDLPPPTSRRSRRAFSATLGHRATDPVTMTRSPSTMHYMTTSPSATPSAPPSIFVTLPGS